ncbi:patatin-like phospholipase family protein [Phenylobacterium ferrooxidans]|uniref:Patatin-like phospholipase family protein n=1 Tax=Phenylobacterium ferrooxidans TaxID=2982689 RepID=A0ABW6CSM9_9CAUL
MSRSARLCASPEQPKPNGTPFQSVALLLQGGGALGAYQAGVYEALAERGVEPTWLAGISIGAINSAIIAGNAPAVRVSKLRTFWDAVSANRWPVPAYKTDPWRTGPFRGLLNQWAAAGVMLTGVPGFFSPRFPPPGLHVSGAEAAVSWYEAGELRAMLERLVDFELINHPSAMRFSVGAVNVRTGNFAYFDNATDTIAAEHVMASGALPPAFAPVEVDGEAYWDGGLVSNTPLDWVLSARSGLDTLVFQVDLWSAQGSRPSDLAGVAVRMKEIQYSSRTRAATDRFREQQQLRAALQDLIQSLPKELVCTPETMRLAEAADLAGFNIVQLIYRSPAYEQASKDYDFSRRSMEDHWRAGYENAAESLKHPQTLSLPRAPGEVAVYDFLRSADDSRAQQEIG